MTALRLIGLLVLSATVIAAAQVPLGREPSHRMTFENAELRVLDVNIPPGSATLDHRHDFDIVTVSMTSGMPTRLQPAGQTWGPVRPPRPLGDATAAEYAGKPESHRLENVGTTARSVSVTLPWTTLQHWEPATEKFGGQHPTEVVWSVGGRVDRMEGLTHVPEREFDGDPWHGPCLEDLLKGVNAQVAANRPPGATHSIWELVLHMTGWKREVAQRLGGKEASDPAAGDWPAAGEPDEARWRAVQADLGRAQKELIAAIEALPERRLHEPVKDFRNSALGTGMTAYQTISGLIQHDVYHAGQIAMLRRMAGIR